MDSKFSALIVFLLVATISFSAAADEEATFSELKRKIFAHDAEILSKDENVRLMKQIEPLTQEESEDPNELVKRDLRALLDISQFNEERCKSVDKFEASFHQLARRIPFKLMRGTNFGGSYVEEWNKNIINYINECQREHVKICAEEFNNDMQHMSAHDSLLMSKLGAELVGKEVFGFQVFDAVFELIEATLPKRSPNFIANLGLKTRARLRVKQLHDELLGTCERVTRLADQHGLVIADVILDYNPDDVGIDEKTRDLSDKAAICRLYLSLANPRAQALPESGSSTSKSILYELMDRASAKY